LILFFSLSLCRSSSVYSFGLVTFLPSFLNLWQFCLFIFEARESNW
jgi:hypothetical protein